MITLNGILERLTFQNPDNHYTVARIRISALAEPVTVVGHIAGAAEGETLKLSGRWTSHPRYGDQFKVDTFEVVLPSTLPGIRQYLTSGIIRGLGPGLADRIISHFKEQTLEIIDTAPHRLTEVHGIGKAKQTLIETAWNKHHCARQVMACLQQAGIPSFHAAGILKQYGSRALSVVRTDPYAIARDRLRNGFDIADRIALGAGFAPDDPERIKAFIIHELAGCESDGHVYGLQADIENRCAALPELTPDCVRQAIIELADQGEIIVESLDSDDTRLYLQSLYQAETGIFNRIGTLLSMPAPALDLDHEQIIELVLSNLAVQLSEEQLNVIAQAMNQRLVVITGGPGTGKTTLVRALCTVFSHLHRRMLLSAPTGRAARRLSEVTGKKAFTLHKLLGFSADTGQFEKNMANPLDRDVFIVDEASMVDTRLMYHFLQAVPAQSVVILVGDTFQLPSVGPGSVLADIIASKAVQTFILTRVFRQARQSPIIMAAHEIRDGRMPDLSLADSETPTDLYFIENQAPKKVVDTIIDLCTSRITDAFPHIDEIQVLTPMHKGDAGTINLNQQLQNALNPGPADLDLVSHGITFRKNDKVMHLKNNYEKEVFNGDIGTVAAVSKSDGQVIVDYDGRQVAYDVPELDELTLAYAISVHKSQGSEYTAVVIALTLNHMPLLQRNLLYTAITRGRSLVVMVGSKKAFERALNNNQTQLRRSGLKEKLQSFAREPA